MEHSLGPFFVRDNADHDGFHQTGWKMEGDKHHFDHVTLILKGTYHCRVWVAQVDSAGNQIKVKRVVTLSNGAKDEVEDLAWVMVEDMVREAPFCFLIKAEKRHDFECVQGPGMLWCWFTHRDPQTGDVVQQQNGWQYAYA